VEARTGISSDNPVVDESFELLEEGLRQSIDAAYVEGKRVTYYKHADNSRENFAFPPFAVAALRYFIQDVKTMFEALYGQQWPDGRLPDHIYTDGNPGWNGKRGIRTVMADLETATAAMFCKAWRAHGDDEWIRKLLPSVEATLEYVISDPDMHDDEHALLKRAHTLDEWDTQFPDGEDGSSFLNEATRFVLMQGDTSAIFEASRLLAELYTALGREDRAKYWRQRQGHYYSRGNEIFWDGVKYRHHIHLDPLDHGDFDEDDQLAMSNSWAITRGFADHDKAVSIIREYMRRLEETGDRFPWWSLQPGYPDELGYFATEGAWSKKQGEYCNGGLFPWVGGEICRGAFQHGMEELAYTRMHRGHPGRNAGAVPEGNDRRIRLYQRGCRDRGCARVGDYRSLIRMSRARQRHQAALAAAHSSRIGRSHDKSIRSSNHLSVGVLGVRRNPQIRLRHREEPGQRGIRSGHPSVPIHAGAGLGLHTERADR